MPYSLTKKGSGTLENSESRTLKLKTLYQIGIRLRDVEKVIETRERMFGIGP